MSNNTKLQQRVRTELLSRNISQAELGRQIGYSPATVNLWLKGKYSGDVEKVEECLRDWFGGSCGPETPATDKVHSIDICGLLYDLVVIDARPWVPVEPLCIDLGIDAPAQVLRTSKHRDFSGLEVRVVRHHGKRWSLIPLEELAWFLRSMRPRSEDTKVRIKQIRAIVPLSLFSTWADIYGGWSIATLLRKRSVNVDYSALNNRGPKPQPRFNPSEISEMRRLHTAGKTYAAIGTLYSCPKGTIWHLVRGSTPTVMRTRELNACKP